MGNAVRRNRAKRRLRAAIQPMLAELKPGWDAVLIARQPLLSAPFLELRQALRPPPLFERVYWKETMTNENRGSYIHTTGIESVVEPLLRDLR